MTEANEKQKQLMELQKLSELVYRQNERLEKHDELAAYQFLEGDSAYSKLPSVVSLFPEKMAHREELASIAEQLVNSSRTLTIENFDWAWFTQKITDKIGEPFWKDSYQKLFPNENDPDMYTVLTWMQRCEKEGERKAPPKEPVLDYNPWNYICAASGAVLLIGMFGSLWAEGFGILLIVIGMLGVIISGYILWMAKDVYRFYMKEYPAKLAEYQGIQKYLELKKEIEKRISNVTLGGKENMQKMLPALTDYLEKKKKYEEEDAAKWRAAEEKCDDEKRKLKDEIDALERQMDEMTILHWRYRSDVDRIITIMETGRADSVKEALNVLENDNYSERLIEEQQEKNDMLRQQMREEERHNRMMEEESERAHEEQLREMRREQYAREREQERYEQERRRFEEEQRESQRKLENEMRMREQEAKREEKRRDSAFLAAQKRYNDASLRYQRYASQGLTTDALRAQHEMDVAKGDMMRYKG